MPKKSKYILPLCLALASLTGCGSSDATSGTAATTGKIEIFSFWTAGGEAQALSNLITSYKDRYPGNDVLNSTQGATADGAAAEAFKKMKERLAANDPPDAWQAILGSNLVSYTQFVPPDADPVTTTPVNKTEDLTSLYASEGWSSKIPPGVLSAMKDGPGIYAVPLAVSRINDLYYNKAIFAKYSLTPPKTLADLWAIGEALKGEVDTDGNPIIPMVMAAGYAGAGPGVEAWPARFVADAILMAEPNGIKLRQDYYSGLKSADDAGYLQAAKDFNKLLMLYTNAGNEDLAPAGSDADAQKVHWEDAADMIHSGRAAMFIHGDWVKSYLTSKDDVVDVDFGVVEFPPKAFVYAGDSFVLAKDAPHHQAAIDFLKVIGSPDVQSKFNKLKGALPARTDADTSEFDAIGQQTAADFGDPSVTLVPCSWDYAPNAYWTCWGDAVTDILKNHDPDAFASACADQYPTLKK